MTKQKLYQYENSINEIRKGSFLIKFINIKNIAFSNIEVRLDQKNSEFQFGGALFTPLFELNTYKKEKEQILQRSIEMFDTVVDGNGFKWPRIEKKQNDIDYGIARHKMSTKWAMAHEKRIRHHTLFWSNPKHLPDWAKSLTDKQFRQAVFNRIKYTKERLGNDISSLDVINEMLYFRAFRDRLGDSIIKQIFDETRKAFPKSRLYINEWPAQPQGAKLCIQNKNLSCFDDYINLIEELKEKEIPFDGIGLQGHFDADGIKSSGINIETIIEKFSDVIDNISKSANFPVLITEYDMKTKEGNKS